MLIRRCRDGTFECIEQEHHAFISGILAGAWLPTALSAELVQAIGLHDNPWRPVDANPTFDDESGLPFDFLDYPVDEKVEFYRRGIDALERIHPWVAYLVSRHYTTFAGTRDVEGLVEPEAARRERLRDRLGDRFVEGADAAVEWMKYFDIWSLYVCLAGPAASPDGIPAWLADPDDWSEAPDGTPLEMEWREARTLAVEPWPFAPAALEVDIDYRQLAGRFGTASEFRERWGEAGREVRTVELVSSGGA